MTRDYLLDVAKALTEDDDPDNRKFGELLLKVIPEESKQIPLVFLEEIKQEVQRGIEREAREEDGYEVIDWNDTDAIGWIAGSPYVDDPRPGWKKRDLAMFARGYAVGRSIQKGNDNETLRVLLSSLERIERHIKESETAE